MFKTLVPWCPALLSLVAFGCGGGGGGNTPYTPPAPVAVNQPPAADVSGLATNDDGNPVLIATHQAEISIDTTQRGPMQALASCLAVLEQCWRDQGLTEANHVGVMDLCERSVPTCTTSEPWNEETACCPEECWTRYDAGRSAGQDPTTVEEEIYFGDTPCVHGATP